MDSMLENYLKHKYGEDYQKKAEDDYIERSDRANTGAFMSSIGDALAGRAPGSQNEYFNQLKKQAKDDTIGKVEKDRNEYVKNITDNSNINQIQEQDLIRTQENDPTNAQAKSVAQQLRRLGVQVPDGLSLSEMKRNFGDAKSLNEIKMKAQIDYNNKKALHNLENEYVNNDFKKLPKEDQEVVVDLAKKNANKVGIANQIDGVMSKWDSLSDDKKVYAGRQLLKTLNSTEGADAIGSEEAKRLGGQLEVAFGNLTNSNPTQFGRNLPGFKDQAKETADAIRGAIASNNKTINNMYSKVGIVKDTNSGFVNPNTMDIDKKINSFMTKNGIKSKEQAIKILKENGKL